MEGVLIYRLRFPEVDETIQTRMKERMLYSQEFNLSTAKPSTKTSRSPDVGSSGNPMAARISQIRS
jgi:hypothetical protein